VLLVHLVLIYDEAVGPIREARLLPGFVDASVSALGGAEDFEELAVDVLVVMAALGVAASISDVNLPLPIATDARTAMNPPQHGS
jgi:hypothetical protein